MWHLEADDDDDWKPEIHIASKSHVPKTMVVAAIGTPTARALGRGVAKGNGSCKVLMTRVTKMVKRKRGGRGADGVHYAKGQYQRKDCKLNAERFRKVMVDELWPALVNCYGGQVGKVVVQLDNAPPHVGRDTVGVLSRRFAELKRNMCHGQRARVDVSQVPDVELVTQSANSPDVNLCDLAFFSASTVMLRKRRRTHGRAFDILKLEKDVKQVFYDYPQEKLRKMWNTKADVLKKIVYCKGKNNYELHGAPRIPHAAHTRTWNFPALPED